MCLTAANHVVPLKKYAISGTMPTPRLWLEIISYTLALDPDSHAHESGHPVNNAASVLFDRPVFTGSSAFADDDDGGLLLWAFAITPIQVAVLLSQCRQVPKGW
jgi:hypothetical protein